MNDVELGYFKQLSADREESANILEKPSMRGIRRSVVDKYSDRARFVYELIQNADDAGATYANFLLFKDKLVFIHNGTRLFTVTDPSKEAEDSERGTLGDINAITSIANSSKTDASIGKFGVGFKAVFKYTETPYIFDPYVSFKIERFIVPVLIDEECQYKSKKETAFEFPFNHKGIEKEEAYDDISEKLHNLIFPTLFLNHLQKITFTIDGEKGVYEKKVNETYDFGDTLCEFLTLKSGKNREDLYLFSRKTEEEYKYSVGFFVDKDKKLVPRDYYAFCFFPTKVNTNLKFIINAPFLLNDSREGIVAKEEHNVRMINLLASLAADSFPFLRDIGKSLEKTIIDDDILWMIPYLKEKYDVNEKGSDVSFVPFYEKVKEMMKTEEILWADGRYISTKKAYIALSPAITNVFNDHQLAELYDDEGAGWVFKTYGYETIYRARDGRGNYLSSLLINPTIQDEAIVEKITEDFISHQEHEWLLRLYSFISDTSKRIECAKTIPIFITEEEKVMAAYDEDNQEILFIPASGISGFNVISEQFIKEEEVKKLVELMGLSKPSIRDEIYNKIVYKYKNDSDDIDEIEDFKKLYAYYKDCPQSEVDEYIELIKECQILLYTSREDGEDYRTTADQLYYPSEELEKYFVASKYINFLDLETYKAEYNPSEYGKLEDFFIKLGIKTKPAIKIYKLQGQELDRLGIEWPRTTFKAKTSWRERRLDGAWELAKYIVENQSKESSVCLWNQMVSMQMNSLLHRFPLYSVYQYFFHSEKTMDFEGPCQKRLKSLAWVVNKDGIFCKPTDIALDDLDEAYDVTSEMAIEVADYLGMRNSRSELPDNLTDDQADALRIGQMVQKAGVAMEDILAFINAKQKVMAEIDDENLVKEVLGKSDVESTPSDASLKFDKFTGKAAAQVMRKANSKKQTVAEYVKKIIDSSAYENNENAVDEDDFTSSAIDYQKKKEQIQDKSSADIAKIAMLEEAQNRAVTSKKYTYEWFKALLDLELLNSSEKTSNSNKIHISFAKVSKEEGSERILLLKYPSQSIPQMMEDLSDILLTLHFAEDVKQIPIEVASVMGYTLKVRAKSESSIAHVHFDEIKEATIDAQSPIFLLDALRKEFESLEQEQNYDMRAGLPENLEFVFGPPGTGKTTCLAKDYLLPLCKKGRKIIVLAPTNKAADVITQRLIDLYEGNDISDWLIRFGVTSDEKLESCGVHKDRELNISKLSSCVLVTTIARLPYDYFMLGNGETIRLNEIEWDYVVFDEASMIPLYQVIYPLYKFSPRRFVFAGDPFQIEPIAAVDMWKGENIYTLVGLNSFEKPETSPYKYQVKLLTTQYRSIPSVCRIYSELTYGGLLKSARKENSQKELNISDIIELNTLNIIKFPVSKYESIYKSRRLNNSSPYHIYSAIFTFEFVM